MLIAYTQAMIWFSNCGVLSQIVLTYVLLCTCMRVSNINGIFVSFQGSIWSVVWWWPVPWSYPQVWYFQQWTIDLLRGLCCESIWGLGICARLKLFCDAAWFKVFRIIPEFSILRLTFHVICAKLKLLCDTTWVNDFRIIPEFRIKILNLVDYDSLSDWFLDNLATIAYLILNTASFKIWASKVHDFGNLVFSRLFLNLMLTFHGIHAGLKLLCDATWVNDFRIIPEFRIKVLNLADYDSLSDWFLDNLATIAHLNFEDCKF